MAETSRIFHDTSIWEGLLLAYLVCLGILAMVRRTTSLAKQSIVPIVFTLLGLMQLCSSSKAVVQAAMLWGVAVAICIAIGMRIASTEDISIDREKNSIVLPGSPLTLILIMTNFVWKYWMDFTLVARASAGLANIEHIYILAEAAMSGAITGIFAGRFIGYWRRCRMQDDGN